jgi:hypothetical protein
LRNMGKNMINGLFFHLASLPDLVAVFIISLLRADCNAFSRKREKFPVFFS